MDYTTLTSYVFAVVSTLYILHLGFYLVGANIYDVWQVRRHHRRFWTAAKGLTKIYNPKITVAISAHNEEKVIVRCLESIRGSGYENVQILVIDDCSKDDTYQLVRNYVREHPDLDIRLLHKRKNVGKGKALNYALRKYAAGELVMTLDADSVLMPTSIANAVSYFTNPLIVGVAANVQIMDDFTVLGVLQKFEHMVGYRSKKVYSVCNCEFVIGGVASTYRMDVLRAVDFYDTDTITEDIGLSMKIISRGNRTNRIIYGADVVAKTEGVTSFHALIKQRFRWKYGSLQNLIKYRYLIHKRDFKTYTPWLTFYRLPMAIVSEFVLLLAPVIWAYVLYWTLAQASLRLIIGTYVTITVYTFITIWFDENTSFRDRVHLSLYAPTAYFIYYIMDFVQLAAMVKCLRRTHHLLKRKEIAGTWVSPPRTGNEGVAV
jgi:poly-beta-1,6-N-acetyl-D-glucosamine synthase